MAKLWLVILPKQWGLDTTLYLHVNYTKHNFMLLLSTEVIEEKEMAVCEGLHCFPGQLKREVGGFLQPRLVCATLLVPSLSHKAVVSFMEAGHY